MYSFMSMTFRYRTPPAARPLILSLPSALKRASSRSLRRNPLWLTGDSPTRCKGIHTPFPAAVLAVLCSEQRGARGAVRGWRVGEAGKFSLNCCLQPLLGPGTCFKMTLTIGVLFLSMITSYRIFLIIRNGSPSADHHKYPSISVPSGSPSASIC